MTLIQPVILCGGGGTRLWPLSRRDRPKPFLPLLGERTLFQQTIDRVSDRDLFTPPIVVAGAAHEPLIRDQGGNELTLIVEPAARNTAPAIALAALSLPEDAIMLVCPSDHYIANDEAFISGVRQAVALAREGRLVAFGIDPTAPETGYGYIRKGAALGEGFQVDSFVEKPDAATAQQFLASGQYCWNGGIFAFAAGDFVKELGRHRPEMARSVAEAMAQANRRGTTIYPALEPFAAIQAESVDYAVMENTDRAAVVSADMGWSDIGNWDALHTVRPCDEQGNHTRGTVELRECSRVMVESDGPRVSVVGLEDVVVVIDGNDVLVTSRAHAQSVGKLAGAAQQ